VTGFADATGRFLPLACTLNGSRVLDAMGGTLGVDHAELSRLALSAEPGAGGLVLVPYLEGERTPNLPTATGSLLGATLSSMTRPNLARAAVEGVLGLMAGCLDAVTALGMTIDRVALVGGGARSEAIRELAPGFLGVPVDVPDDGEWVAAGAARQAAWVLSGADAPPHWEYAAVTSERAPDADALARYRDAASQVADGLGLLGPG
jgi:xylulokinase